jgi:hypothetical protein
MMESGYTADFIGNITSNARKYHYVVSDYAVLYNRLLPDM